MLVASNRIHHPAYSCVAISLQRKAGIEISPCQGLGFTHEFSRESVSQYVVPTGYPDNSQTLVIRHLMEHTGTPSWERSLTLYDSCSLHVYTDETNSATTGGNGHWCSMTMPDVSASLLLFLSQCYVAAVWVMAVLSVDTNQPWKQSDPSFN